MPSQSFEQKNKQKSDMKKLRNVEELIMLDAVLEELKQAFCSWGHVTRFLENFYIMDYTLKSTRNGKSASTIPKWPSLSPLE